MSGSLRWLMGLFCLLLGGFAPVRGAEPEIANLSLRGLQINGTTTLVLSGDGFTTNPRLLLPFAAKVTLKPGSTDKQATFEVTLGEEVVPGYHHLRLVSDNGVSLPMVMTVDRLPQLPLAPLIEKLPVAIHGSLSGGTIVETTFTGKSGQKLTLEVEAQRIGSKLRPILHLYTPKKLQLGWAWGNPSLSGDVRMEATLPEDGVYRVTLHDAEYQGPGPGHFRLRVGNWNFVDQVFPQIVGKEMGRVELSGSGTSQAELPKMRTDRWLPLPWPKDGVWSGPRPFVEPNTGTELLETPSPGKPQELPAGAVGVSGRLSAPFEEDRYRLPVTAGAKIRLSVFAERIGSPIDVSMVLRNEAGAEIQRIEDGPGTLDPVVEYTVPPNVPAILVGVLDSQGRGGPKAQYRLTVEPVSATPGRTTPELTSPVRRLSVPVEGRMVVPVWLDRGSYNGAMEIHAAGLPNGVKLDGVKIPPGASGTLVTLTRGTEPVPPTILTWKGQSEDGRLHPVIQKNHPMERLQPWMATEVPIVGTIAAGKEFGLDWNTPKDTDVIVPGRRLPLSVKVTRTGMPGPVRLTLLTSQLPILVNNQPDPAKSIRLEKALELPATAADGEVALLIPTALSEEVYDLAVQAEFLSPDKKIVLATAYSSVRRLPVRWPFALQLESPAKIDVKLDPKTGATFEIAGAVQFLDGLAGDVPLTLTGLPAGGKADPLTVKSGTKPFKIKVTLPANAPVGELKGLKLSGTFIPDPKVPAQLVRSRDVELTLNILSAK